MQFRIVRRRVKLIERRDKRVPGLYKFCLFVGVSKNVVDVFVKYNEGEILTRTR